MKKNIMALLSAALMVCGSFAAYADTENLSPEEKLQRQLEGRYYADEAGYYSGFYSEGLSSWTDVLFDSEREVYFIAEENEDIKMYANGYFLSELNNVLYVKDAEGNVIFSTESLGVSGFGMLQTSQRNRDFFRDGYVLVYNMKESISGVTYEMGVINTAGEWVVPLSSDNPLITSGFKCSSDAFEEKITYGYEGMLIVPVNSKEYDYDYYLYSIEDNQAYMIQPDDSNRNIDYIVSYATFENGVCNDTYKKTAFQLNKDGTMHIYASIPEDIKLNESYGFCIDQAGNMIRLIDSSELSVVSSADGLVKELTNINLVGCVTREDYWVVTAENSEGSVYYTAIGLDGSFLYEPVKTDAVFICLEDGSELKCKDKAGQPYGKKIVLDEEGNVLFESTYEDSEISVKNGVVFEFVEGYNKVDIEEFTLIEKEAEE